MSRLFIYSLPLNMNQNIYSIEPENNLTTENCHVHGKNIEIYSTLSIFASKAEGNNAAFGEPSKKQTQTERKVQPLSVKLLPHVWLNRANLLYCQIVDGKHKAQRPVGKIGEPGKYINLILHQHNSFLRHMEATRAGLESVDRRAVVTAGV